MSYDPPPLHHPHFCYSEGFGYKWCPAIRFDDLMAKKGFTIKCPHADPKEAAFRFQAWVQTDANDALLKYVAIPTCFLV